MKPTNIKIAEESREVMIDVSGVRAYALLFQPDGSMEAFPEQIILGMSKVGLSEISENNYVEVWARFQILHRCGVWSVVLGGTYLAPSLGEVQRYIGLKTNGPDITPRNRWMSSIVLRYFEHKLQGELQRSGKSEKLSEH